MIRLLRTLLLAAALLSSGALQLAAAAGEEPCCPGETGGESSDPGCPPGLACACCPTRGAVQGVPHALVPVRSRGVAVSVATQAPRAFEPPADIFQPPRA